MSVPHPPADYRAGAASKANYSSAASPTSPQEFSITDTQLDTKPYRLPVAHRVGTASSITHLTILAWGAMAHKMWNAKYTGGMTLGSDSFRNRVKVRDMVRD